MAHMPVREGGCPGWSGNVERGIQRMKLSAAGRANHILMNLASSLGRLVPEPIDVNWQTPIAPLHT